MVRRKRKPHARTIAAVANTKRKPVASNRAESLASQILTTPPLPAHHPQEHGAEHRHHQGAAQLPEEVHQSRGRAHAVGLDRVLDGNEAQGQHGSDARPHQGQSGDQQHEGHLHGHRSQADQRRHGEKASRQARPFVMGEARDEPPGGHCPRHHPRRQRNKAEARLAGGEPAQAFEIKRHIDRQAQHGAGRREARRHRTSHHRIGEHVEGQERLACALDAPDEEPRQHDRAGQEAEDQGRRPRQMHPAPGERQQQADGAQRQQRRAGHIEIVLALMPRQAPQGPVGHQIGEQAQRQVDPEDEGPVQMLGDEAAQHRPRHAGRGEDGGDLRLVARPLAGRDHVRDDGLGQRDEAAAAQALQRPRQHQQQKARGQRRDERGHGKDRDGDEQHDAPPVNVGQLAIERRRHRGRQQIGGDHPRQVGEILKMGADGGQRRGDDGLVQRAQEHRQHDAEDDAAHLAVRQVFGGRGHGFRLREAPARDRRT